MGVSVGQEGSAAMASSGVQPCWVPEQCMCSWWGGGCCVPILKSGWAPLSQSCLGSILMGRGVNGSVEAQGLQHASGQ